MRMRFVVSWGKLLRVGERGRFFVGTFARSAPRSADGRVSGSGSGDASGIGVEGTFGRNVCTFRDWRIQRE